MKVLNLDKLAKKEARELVIFGKTYPVDEMTVDNFIATTKDAERLANEVSMAKQVEATVEMIVRSVPTVDAAVLGKLGLERLKAIVSFIREEEMDGVETHDDTEDGAEKK